MIYLAAPYTSPEMDTRNWRYHRTKNALFHLWDSGLPAICPVVLGHEYERRQKSGPKEMPHEFWMVIARAQLSSCTGLYVLTLPGWEESAGVKMEVELAVGMGKAVQGFAPINDCEDVSGFQILNEFGIALPRKPKIILQRREDA